MPKIQCQILDSHHTIDGGLHKYLDVTLTSAKLFTVNYTRLDQEQ